jgi:hypothetical protein
LSRKAFQGLNKVVRMKGLGCVLRISLPPSQCSPFYSEV